MTTEMTTPDTPRTDDCPHCGMAIYALPCDGDETTYWRCGTDFVQEWGFARSAECYENQLAKSKAEVERLTGRMKEVEDLIKGIHDGWKKARKAHRETCKNAQREIDKLHTKNVCLQELIQEFYEWTKRDYPTEQEVREIMNRYHDLLNK